MNRKSKAGLLSIALAAFACGLAGTQATHGVATDAHEHKAAGAESPHTDTKKENEPSDAHRSTSAQSDGHAHAEGAESGHGDEVTLTTESIAQSGIVAEPAAKRLLCDQVTFPGRVSYNVERMAHVGTPVAGRITEVRAKLGDVVSKGDVLFVLDSSVLGEAEADLLQKKSDADVAATSLEIAQASFERAKRLVASNAVPGNEFQLREGELKKASGALRAAQSALRSAESKLHLYGMDEAAIGALSTSGEINSRLTIAAPIAGTVIEREATVGEIVSPDRDALLVLADMTSLWVLADVPESQLTRIALGTTATVTLDVAAERVYEGPITYVAPALNSETRTAQVRVELHDGNLLKPGMFAHVKLALPGGKEHAGAVLCVPETSVHSFEGGSVVFVQSPEGPNTFAAQPVKTGEPMSGMVPVLSGIDEGAPVVTAGSFVIKAEMAKAIMEGKTCSGH